MKKILFLTNLIPYPLDNGGKIKSHNIIKALSQKYDIDLMCFSNNESDKKYAQKMLGIVKNIHVIPKTLIRSTSFKNFIKDYSKSLFSLYPYSINKYYDNRFKEELVRKLTKDDYEFVYVDHLPMMVYFKYIKNHKVILDQHNVESLIFKRMIINDNNIFKKILGSIEYIKLLNFEKKSILQSNHVICLSEDDKKVLSSFGLSNEKVSVLPIHIDLEKNYNYKVSKDGKINLLFLGSMSWYPNQHGIKWFMENVWPKLKDKNFNIYIVGSNPPEVIKKYQNDKNVFVTGYVDDVDMYIEKCDVSIVPLFVGSGQRVKIIESFGKKIPVISTAIGAEGIKYSDREDIMIADNKEEFIAEIINILKKPFKLQIISEKAYENFKENYSAQILPSKLEAIINDLKKD
ncbi:glycosyltransferase [Bacillus sp. FJAT-50079]|uniref:glycosyltransferase n=1 Tax=Bacillus sp. FJAT-50079 TaxID=2833577 RepID=UPI001BCA2241|nr:glycosyltransferase [Bacillus sp. FJAT-50079]MBS4206710.1 glycosyltransferase [Bacillus sp. FJAT-50079]